MRIKAIIGSYGGNCMIGYPIHDTGTTGSALANPVLTRIESQGCL